MRVQVLHWMGKLPEMGDLELVGDEYYITIWSTKHLLNIMSRYDVMLLDRPSGMLLFIDDKGRRFAVR